MTPRKTLKALGALLLSVCAGLAGAQDNYPSKPITMVVPFPPGGVADVVGRPVADAMSRHLNQSVVVVNRAGAGGGIGMAQVAKAAPDGYTVLMALSSLVVLPEADRILNRPPMFELSQLIPVARMTADPTVLVVRADSPWKTYQEFIAYARSNPSKISFGSSGTQARTRIMVGRVLLRVTGAGQPLVPPHCPAICPPQPRRPPLQTQVTPSGSARTPRATSTWRSVTFW